MLVYRVENAAGGGPYQGNLQWHPSSENSRSHPGPYSDKLLAPHWGQLWTHRRDETYSFGFMSLDALLEWFYDPSWREHAEAMGYAIAVYEIDPEAEIDGFLGVYLGTTQLVFRKDRARRASTISLTSLSQQAAAPGRNSELPACHPALSISTTSPAASSRPFAPALWAA